MKIHVVYSVIALVLIAGFASCDKYLTCEPLSSISPENYFKEESQLRDYVNNMYDAVLLSVPGNSISIYGSDTGTDNQVKLDEAPSQYDTGEWKVPQSGGNWNFENIYRCNYFFSMVNPRFGNDLAGGQNTITGNLANIRHYIGEMYVLRALAFYEKYQKFGDFPIITDPLPDDMDQLTAASARSPRNEVARFIISDLDKAISLMDGNDGNTTRINRDVAVLIKSNVALFEASWLKNYKGTAFVPLGEGWPGSKKDYNASYKYPSGSIDDEITYFLDICLSASKDVAERYKGSLTENTGHLQQSGSEAKNPYYDMFAAEDMSKYPEIMLWRRYASSLKSHGICIGLLEGNTQIGLTRSLVQNALMADGTPVYTHGTYADGDGYYLGDKTIADLRANRDSRLSLFLIEPGQKNIYAGSDYNQSILRETLITAPVPDVLCTSAYKYSTGYVTRKGSTPNADHYNGANAAYTGLPIYRATEALLNYMEAFYEKNGTLDATAREYWKIIRKRAKVSEDIDATIAATDMSKEAENDWGAYTAGKLIDATLYNIRRERRMEFICEGYRYRDLCRWRSMDQLITEPYIPEGMHFWNTPMQEWYDNDKIVCDGSTKANLSSPSSSEYLRPFQKRTVQHCYNGFTWSIAHYLEPIAIKHMMVTASDGATVSDSPIYQNPYWPVAADLPAEK